MKVVLDIDKLLADGQITAGEYDRFKTMSLQETGSLAFNILIGFGVIATAGGALGLLHSSPMAIALGTLLAIVGLTLTLKRADQWELLGNMLLTVGSVAAAGGVVSWTEGSVIGFLIVTILCTGAAIIARSILLSIMATLSLSATVGAMTAYGHATYALTIQQPAVTVVLFGLLAWAAYHVSKNLIPEYERIAIAISRTSLFMVNLGFWVGSLWGDSLWPQKNNWTIRSAAVIPDWVFAIAWAIGLIIAGIWAVRANKRWVVNLLAVFGAIHFYTQYFERLGATPGSILVAGLMAIAIAYGIVWYNKSSERDAGMGSQVAS
jgi:hypothetical protein